MKTGSIIVACILTAATTAVGQIVYEWENQIENYHYRVKNIEFFIDRFNNQPEGSGHTKIQNPPDSNSLQRFVNERDNMIFSLFDLKSLNKKDEELKRKINAFFLKVNNTKIPVFLNFNDAAWFVELLLTIRYQNQEYSSQCILQITQLAHKESVWSIQAFSLPELKIQDRISSDYLAFPPNINGTDFMAVPLALSNPEWIKQKTDSLTGTPATFLKKIKTNELTVSSINQITYHFLQVDNWGFTVRYENRESKNSGWLIHELFELPPEEKALYLKRYLID